MVNAYTNAANFCALHEKAIQTASHAAIHQSVVNGLFADRHSFLPKETTLVPFAVNAARIP